MLLLRVVVATVQAIHVQQPGQVRRDRAVTVIEQFVLEALTAPAAELFQRGTTGGNGSGIGLALGRTIAEILSQLFRRSRRGVTSNPMPASKNNRSKIRSG